MGCAYWKHCIIMAIRSIVLVLFALFLVSASGTYCLHSSDCLSDLQTCCSDHVCRQTCYFCSYDYQCGSEECCSPNGNCWMKCSDGGCRKDCFYCSKDSECDAGRGECCWDSDCRKKCSDGVCRGQCLYCVASSECGAGECCDDNGDCKLDCTPAVHVSLTHAGIAGIVVACAVVVAIVVSIIACFCCACCPYYRNRHEGATVLVGSPSTGYHQFVSTASSQQIAQASQPLPQIGPYAAHQDQEPSPNPPRPAPYPSPPGVSLGPYPQQKKL